MTYDFVLIIDLKERHLILTPNTHAQYGTSKQPSTRGLWTCCQRSSEPSPQSSRLAVICTSVPCWSCSSFTVHHQCKPDHIGNQDHQHHSIDIRVSCPSLCESISTFSQKSKSSLSWLRLFITCYKKFSIRQYINTYFMLHTVVNALFCHHWGSLEYRTCVSHPIPYNILYSCFYISL